ncbi:MAG: tyrosine-type recombinase/integrase [Clostridiales bacterium]
MRGYIYKKVKKYYVIIDIGKDLTGKRIRKWFSGFNTKQEAEKGLTKLLYEMDTNTFIDPSKMTVEEFLESWLEDYVDVNLSNNTIAGYRVNVRNHIIPYIGNIKLQKLQPITIQHLYKKLLKEGRSDGKGGLSAKSVVYVHRNLRKALNQAYKLQLIYKNPADCVEPPRVKHYEAKFLNENQSIRLLNAFEGSDIYVPVLLAVSLGLRRCEVLGIRWRDIDIDNKKLSVNKLLEKEDNQIILADVKTRKSKRTLSIPQSVVDVVKWHKKIQEHNKNLLDNSYIDLDLINCRNDGNPMSTSTFNKKFTRILKRNNLEHMRFHDLRHTNASLMLKYKIPAKVAADNLGHSKIGVTMDIYSHIFNESHEEVANAFEENLFKKINP